MKWLKIIIDIVIALIPGGSVKKVSDLKQDLAIATKTIDYMSNSMTPEAKGEYIEQAIGSLKAVKNFKKRAAKKLDKARVRLYKKLF